ncbi:MAG: GH92 family glycosyl hydrolase [Prevotellaceae bacterium]|jgi:predicted alpha-1,2-mannosidase|nr:GH92 family glycosyl hydrolase [Prevotellaceae bacterium]
MKRFLLSFSIVLIPLCILAQRVNEVTDPVEYVNPLMGTLSKFSLSTGNTYPAIAMPWGMNFWVPQTGKMGDGWAYTYTADKIRGFKQTHQPSPWINDYGQFSIMPVTGKPLVDEEERASWFSHKAEVAKPYYYSVYLADHDVTAELSPTERAAVFRFTFPENDNSYIIVDAFDKGSYIKIIPEENKIIGYTTKNSGGIPDNFKNYFVVIFDKPFEYKAVFNRKELKGESGDKKEKKYRSDILENVLEQNDFHVGAVIGFKTHKGEKVNARVASSFISAEQAEINLKELGNKNFDALKAEGKNRWNEVLSKIQTDGGTVNQTCTFYSCLYHSVLFPRKLYEIDKTGKTMHYSPYNGQVLPGFMYTDTGFWDTFRCLFPFLNLVYPSVNAEIQEGLANTYKESGFLPEWASPGHRNCMVGNNSASIVADAYLKGLRGYDIETLYEAVLHGTNHVHPKVKSTGRLGYEYYNTLGYIPYDVGINENAARTLEYAYDDWTIYQLAKALNRPQDEIDLFAERCLNYRNLFDPETKLMRGKNENGTFQSPFNPLKWGDAFTEGNSWHYTWSVFHDVQGLIDLMGGNKSFVSMLDSVFNVPPLFDDSYYGFPIHEIREMQIMNMGNYAHGNQPIQHMIYLYNYAGQPWKAQYWLREVMNKMYTPAPDGYCGDEDNGQTSAWYVFSALGFYPVCPGSDEYVMGAPLFKKVTVMLENGNKIVIDAPNNDEHNRYINTMKVNEADYTKNWLSHKELIKGANISIDMLPKPNTKRGVEKSDAPYSFSNEKK